MTFIVIIVRKQRASYMKGFLFCSNLEKKRRYRQGGAMLWSTFLFSDGVEIVPPGMHGKLSRGICVKEGRKKTNALPLIRPEHLD